MGGLERVANLVRAVRLGALVVVLVAAVGGSWASIQPAVTRAPGPTRTAAVYHAAAQARTMPNPVFVVASGKPVSPVCVTPGAVAGANMTMQGWNVIPNRNTPFQGCPRP